MKQDDLERFADDLRDCTGLDIGLALDPSPDGLHVLKIDGADFFFNADGSGYDGWGKKRTGAGSNGLGVEESDQPLDPDTPVARKESGDGE